jgi:Tol biopolymer transport system component
VSVRRARRWSGSLYSCVRQDGALVAIRSYGSALAVCLSLGCSDGVSDNEKTGTQPVFPIHHERAAWSSLGEIAFRDNGIVCVGPRGGAEIDPDLAGIWVIDIETRQVDMIALSGDDAAWAPGGRVLAYQLGSDVLVADLNTGRIQPVTAGGKNGAPAWSRSGTHIAYESTAENHGGFYSIWTVRGDGLERRRVTSNSDSDWRFPDWSLDDEWIVHVRRMPSVGLDIFAVTLNGEQMRLTENTIPDTSPQYSPDGQSIAFVSQGRVDDGYPRIVVTDADGTNPRVFAPPACDPAWSPDGSFIAFTWWDRSDDAPGNGVLWILDLQTGLAEQLTHKRSCSRRG